ncbi:MAG: NUDIX hydrolase [Lachnospiraceae bacterium]|nr:NUDIX hydrolase [Lachnospiraceae bacterium]
MRNRSMALVVRDEKILMVQTFRRGRYIWELPGGGIEVGETPEEAALRELQEECGLVGVINRPLNTLHCKDGSVEYVFLVDVSEEQKEIVGRDPEVAEGQEQSIKNVSWKKLDEISEKDRAFLWSYGLLNVDNYFELVLSWGDEISYPIEQEAL